MTISGRDGTPSSARMTLVEIVVVLALMLAIMAIAIPSVSVLFDLQQRSAARTLASTYLWLIDEAQLRNVTFRIVYDLDRGTWKVEAGDPRTLVFATPEDREAYEKDLHDKMSRFTTREKEAGATAESGTDDGGGTAAASNQFSGLTDELFTTEQELPTGTRFASVYTPQYGEVGVVPHDEPPDDPAEDAVAYTYVFPDGSAEHTIIRVVGIADPEDGFTIHVEPLTGKVSLITEVLDPKDALPDLPDQAPDLQ